MTMHRTGRLSTPRPVRLQRSTIARLLLALSFLVLVGAAGRLQVLNVDTYATIAKNNRLREVIVPAPRGTIYDRHGLVIAENVVGYRISIMPGNRDSMNAQLKRLQPVIGISDQDLERATNKWLRAPHLPMVVMADASIDAVAHLEEQRALYPGVLVHEYAKRHYPSGNAVAHIIGYVSEIDDRELKLPKFAGYQQGWWVGKTGLESQYEQVIGGTPGSKYLEIDAQGRIKRWLPDVMGLPPIPGRDLQTYLDLDLQRYIMGIWPRQFRGGFIAIEPSTGGVLAYYSHPSYDANLFIGGIASTEYNALRDDPGNPLLDRVAGGGAAQPPASTWKLAVAAMALEEKVITPEEFMPVACSGGMAILGRPWVRCWEKLGHGRVDLNRGIMLSCDVYFYQVGARLGLKRFTEVGTRMGFAKKTGIDLPSEARNSFPESPEYWQRRMGYRAKESEVVSLAIGQGPTTMTPLKMATIYTAMARADGKAPEPRIAILPDDTTRGTAVDLNLTAHQMEALWKGMRRVVAPGGTAGLTRLRDWDIMGKTGTAQACAACPLKDHAWFVGMAGPKGKDPEIVAAMFLQHAEHGWTASDYVGNAMDFYLDRKYGRPFERFATARSKSAKNLPIEDFAFLPVVDYPREGQPPPPDTTKKKKQSPERQ
jgi:penicillin-binding protein 2